MGERRDGALPVSIVRTGFHPARLFVEVSATVAIVCVAVGVALPAVVPRLDGTARAVVTAALLTLVAGPWIYWRCLAATRRAVRLQRSASQRAAAPAAAPGTGRPGGGRLSAPILMTAAVHLGGLALTGAVVVWLQRDLDTQLQRRFERQIERIETDILQRFERPLFGLEGARGAYAASTHIARADFRAYVESRRLEMEFPGLRGFGFIERVERADLERFVAAERADGAPQFAVRTQGAASDLYVIKFIEPLWHNLAAWGYDIGSEPVRREAAERAVATGEPTLTGRVTLLQDDRRSAGFLYLLPVYRNGVDSVMTPAQRQATLVGLVYAPIIVAELLQSAPQHWDPGLRLRLYDGPAATGASLLYEHGQATDADVADPPALRAQRTLHIGGRALTLEMRGTAAFAAETDGSSLVFAAIGGALLSLLMALVVWLLSVGRVRALAAARRMTADLDRLAKVVQATSNGVLICDTEFRVQWVNEGFTRMSGYTLHEIHGRRPAELLASERRNASEHARLQGAVAAGEGFRGEIVNRARDGRDYWLEIDVQPLRDERGTLVGFMAIETDITAQKQAEDELRRSYATMQAIVDNLPCGLSVFDGKLELVVHNRQFRTMLDLPDRLFDTPPATTFESIIRHNVERGEYGASADVESLVRQIVERARSPVPHRIERERPNGLVLDIHGAPMPGGGFVTTYTDVSKRRRAEQQLEERTVQAEQASVAKSRFVANMSHEIRTPMNAILGMLELLRKTPLTARQRDYAAKTERAARSLLGLLNDILDFSKVEAGKMQLDPRPFSVERLLRELSLILSANAGAKGIEVLYDIDPGVPDALVGDDMRLQQVLINLGGNAIKFTAEGEVVLRVRALQRQAARVRLAFAVADTGIGIAPEHQRHVFGGFSQAEASTTRRFGGTGLGLAICQRLVALMGGELALASVPGEGSTFSFEVEFALATERDVVAPQDDDPPATATDPALRVLVVDDHATARATIAAAARALGWRVDAALDAADAFTRVDRAAADGAPYDAVFVDCRMPGIDGWQACRRIRARGDAEPPRLIMLTAHGREMLAERSAEEQALLDGFLVKPVTAAMMAEALAAAFHPAPAGAEAPSPRAGAPRLAGLRVLIVDDNANNRQIASELLADEGAQVDVAADGAQGVAAVAAARPDYDAVLMDVQMPVMDGYAATQAIRRELGRTALPIVAMTANALPADREACLAAGMNDHVGKPFDLDALVATLRRVAGRAGAATSPTGDAGASAAAPAVCAASAATTSARLDVDAALARIGGHRGAYVRMLRGSLTDIAASADALDAHLAAGRGDDAGRLMHTMKGLAATIGAVALSALAARCERSLDARAPGDAGEVAALSGAWRAAVQCDVPELERAAAELGVVIEPAAADRAVAVPLDELLRRVDELAALLRDADMAAFDACERLRAAPGVLAGASLDELDAAVGAFDFERAASLCDELVQRLR